MANEAVKQQAGKITGLSNRGYRIVYNLYLYRTPSAVFYQTTAFFIAIGTLVSIAGSIIMFFSVKNYDLNAFFGFREETMMPLQIRGLNKYVRHPLYSGTIILALGFCIALPYTKCWLLLALMIIYILSKKSKTADTLCTLIDKLVFLYCSTNLYPWTEIYCFLRHVYFL